MLASEGTIEARSASEGMTLLALRTGEESKSEVLPAWVWVGLALGWFPSYDRDPRSWWRRGLRNEEVIQ